jgi:myo-inositol catabolism protein IolS
VQYRRLGKTGWDVSTVSLGCWGIGGQWGPVAEGEAIAVMHEAIELGVNLFDTADAYGPMTSEELVGKALVGRRDRVYVATKVGNFGRRQSSPLAYDVPEHVYLCCDASLHRLGSDYIDLYQCHIGDLADPSIFLEAFERLVERGKVRAYGISTNSLAVAQAFNRDGRCATVQLNYSIANPSAGRDLLPWCQQNDVGTLIRGPLAQGVLAGKFTAETRFDDSVRRGWNEGAAHEQFLRRLALVDRLEWLERPSRPLAQAALQWVLANPAVTCAIPGAKSLAQIRANAGAADGALSAEELGRVEEAIAAA